MIFFKTTISRWRQTDIGSTVLPHIYIKHITEREQNNNLREISSEPEREVLVLKQYTHVLRNYKDTEPYRVSAF